MFRPARGFLLLVAAATAAACAGGGERSDDPARGSAALHEQPDEGARQPDVPAQQPVEQGPTRASVEPEAPAAAPMPRRIAVMELRMSPVEATQAEDGRGATVAAGDPLALDLRAPEGFPGRARDPVLHVGQLRFVRYSHPAPDTLRFVVSDRSLLPEGAEVALQYGDDEGSRVVVTPALEVPR